MKYFIDQPLNMAQKRERLQFVGTLLVFVRARS